MKFKITPSDAYPTAIISLHQNEKILIENGSMLYHNGEVELEGKMNSNGKSGLKGALGALGRSITSGESVFITKVTGHSDQAEIAVAPSTPGQIRELPIGTKQWRLNTGAFLACDASVSYTMVKQQVAKAVFAGTGGLYVMETAGEGTMLINGYGDIIELTVDGNKPFTVDNSHVIAWESSLDYSIKAASGVIGFKTGEGLVNEFRGHGTVLIQSRNIETLASKLSPFIQKKSN